MPQGDGTGDSALDKRIEGQLRGVQVRLLYANLAMSALVSLGCALLVVAFLWPETGSLHYAGWLAAMVVVQLVRLGTARRFALIESTDGVVTDSWLSYFLVGTAAAGLLWGVLAGGLFPVDDPAGQAFLGITLAGLTGGAVTTLSASIPAMLLFTLPALVPLAIRFAAEGSGSGWALAGLTCVFIAGVLAAGRRTGITLRQNERLRIDLEERERMIAEANSELRGVFDNVEQFFVLVAGNGRILRCNRTALDFAGVADEADLVGTALVDGSWWPQEERGQIAEAFALATSGRRTALEMRLEMEDGGQCFLDVAFRPLGVDDELRSRVVVSATDLTERILAAAATRASEEKFRALVERSLAGVYIIEGGRFTYVNPVFATIFGYSREEIVDAFEVTDLVMEEDRDTVRENLRKRLDGEVSSLRYQFRGRHRDGHAIEVEVMGTRSAIDGRPVVIGTLLDVTERQRIQRHVEHLANYDVLTDLPNRRLLAEHAVALINAAHDQGQSLAFMFLDLDRFKNINDAHGHAVGDRLLVQVAKRLERCLRDGDIVAHMGGDEFGFLLPGASIDAAAAVAVRVIDTLGRPFEIDGHIVRTGGSLGIAPLSEVESDFERLAKCADIAMYRAKRLGNGYAIYESGEATAVSTRFALENDLREALATRALEVYYQPRIDMVTGHYDSVEALARWKHPGRGFISPAVFVPIAEESGLINELGRHVLATACRDLVAWKAQGIRVRMAVNLSVFELQDQEIVERITKALTDHELDGDALEIEVTESAAMNDPEANVATLGRFKELGVDLAIDDFGTGYSSLSYLKRLPADYLKIDRSFVDGIAASGASTDADIVRAIVALANSLSLEVIAEGVENAQQEAFLRALGCRYAQGFYYCRPQPSGAMREILLAQRSDQA